MQKKELGVYIHIPFCAKKCIYCDFISFENKLDLQGQYVEKLLEEINNEKDLFKDYKITTIYIGGGTPSIINEDLIGKILSMIDKESDAEITIELNPGTVTKQKLINYKNFGINRLSIGLQSTKNEILKQIGRIHNYEKFLESYKYAEDVGYDNINVDLMIGIPNQSIQDIKDSINKIVNLKPAHISVYSLIIEPNTPLENMVDKNILKLPSDEDERMQYSYVKNSLELKGYKHYEISNFAIDGKYSKHNMNCWEQKEYISFGVSAHSYINKKRFSNTESLNEYLSEDYKKIKILQEVQNIEDEQKEYMLLGLRKIDGIKISKFKEKFNGQNPIFLFKKELDKLVKQELLQVDLDNIKLTRKGLDLANLVWEEFV